MMSYVFDNQKKRPQKIVNSLNEMYKLTMHQNDKDDFVLSNNDMIINVEKKTTSILLYNTGLNIRNICSLFMEK